MAEHLENMSKDIVKRSKGEKGDVLPSVSDSIFLKEFHRLLLDSNSKKSTTELFGLVVKFSATDEFKGMDDEQKEEAVKKRFGYEEAEFKIDEKSPETIENGRVDRPEQIKDKQGAANRV